jgi:hypothetical protein
MLLVPPWAQEPLLLSMVEQLLVAPWLEELLLVAPWLEEQLLVAP